MFVNCENKNEKKKKMMKQQVWIALISVLCNQEGISDSDSGGAKWQETKRSIVKRSHGPSRKQPQVHNRIGRKSILYVAPFSHSLYICGVCNSAVCSLLI
jgi:hypothetical protein